METLVWLDEWTVDGEKIQTQTLYDADYHGWILVVFKN